MQTTTRLPLFDFDAVSEMHGMICGPDSVVEVRILDATISGDNWPRNYFGYFNDAAKMVEELRIVRSHKGCYFVLNPVLPELLARAANRIKRAGKGDATTDLQIVRRAWLPVDCDAVRPAGISSSDQEHKAAITRAEEIVAFLREHGWPEPTIASSGNGAHLLYPIDLPVDDGGLVKRVLETIAQQFPDDGTAIDTKVFNPSRLWKMYGSLVCKGDSIPERPHRMARVIAWGTGGVVVTCEQLEALAKTLQPVPANNGASSPSSRSNGKSFDLESFIQQHGLDVDGPHPWLTRDGDGQKWTLKTSPMCEHHGDGPFIGQMGGGAITAGCQHNSCSWGWEDLRERFDPRATRNGKKREYQQNDGRHGGVGSNGRAYGVVARASRAMAKLRTQDEDNGAKRLFACACRCVEHDLDDSQSIQAIRHYAVEKPFPREWTDAEILNRIRSAENTADRGKAVLFKLTDIGNAERFVQQHGHVLRYVHAWGRWLVWDGACWSIDESGEVERLAKQTARSIWREAAYATTDDELKEITKHARRSESRDRVSAMLHLAQSEPGIPISHYELDSDPWLLNCTNGTIDLHTGRLRRHNPDDFLTKLAPVAYPDEPGVDCPLWEEFLDTIFAENRDLIGYLQKFLGSSLVGRVFEHTLPIWYGGGANGKSVTIETWCDILGRGYAMKAPANLLMARKNEQHPTERADLFGKRFVAAVEAEESGRLNESLIKELTGGDTIRARRMREDFWEFKPSHSIVLVTNHKPIVRGTDNGIWRRLRLVPFDVTIPTEKQDKQLSQKLQAEAGAILRWAVHGCLAWQQDGLQEPGIVVEATNAYRAAEDVLHDFLDELCELGSEFSCKAGDLYGTYSKWCDDRRERPLGQRKFGIRLTERGIERYRNNGIWYRGVGLVCEVDL